MFSGQVTLHTIYLGRSSADLAEAQLGSDKVITDNSIARGGPVWSSKFQVEPRARGLYQRRPIHRRPPEFFFYLRYLGKYVMHNCGA